jgi:DNA repair protein RadC
MAGEKPKRLSICDWDKDSRPRERLLNVGAAALTNAELLAILIHTGTPSQNAVEIMQTVLDACGGSLDKLDAMNYADLTAFKGIGPAKAVTIMAACEFGRRRMKKETVAKSCLDTSDKIFEEVLKPKFWDLTEEQCWVVLLSQRLHLISVDMIGIGGLTFVSADIRKILKMALQKNATAIVLAHNHPSGATRPGKDDDNLTHNLQEACKVMNIRLLDHIVVGGGSYYSYADNGRL